MSFRVVFRFLALSTLCALTACTTVDTSEKPSQKPVGSKKAEVTFIQSHFNDLPLIEEHAWEPALSAFQASCKVIEQDTRWTEVCRQAIQTDPIGAQRFFLNNFTPWQVIIAQPSEAIPSTQGLMTGYYEPLLRGSRTKGGPFQYPLYRVPDDLLTIDLGSLYPQLKGLRLRGKLDGQRVIPYDDRASIQKRQDLQPYAIAWVDDPVAAFFLHIQGSGRIQLPDGSHMRVGFADQNGHRYHAIGAWLIQKGFFKSHELSMQRIQHWAKTHPNQVDEALAQNPSYVFFAERTIAPNLGPTGAQGIPLTPEASVAVDLRYWLLGTPFIVDAHQTNPTLKITRPVIAQDTGGAIRGPIRFDFFWGFGDQAGAKAGRQKSNTEAWILVPNGQNPESFTVR